MPGRAVRGGWRSRAVCWRWSVRSSPGPRCPRTVHRAGDGHRRLGGGGAVSGGVMVAAGIRVLAGSHQAMARLWPSAAIGGLVALGVGLYTAVTIRDQLVETLATELPMAEVERAGQRPARATIGIGSTWSSPGASRASSRRWSPWRSGTSRSPRPGPGSVAGRVSMRGLTVSDRPRPRSPTCPRRHRAASRTRAASRRDELPGAPDRHARPPRGRRDRPRRDVLLVGWPGRHRERLRAARDRGGRLDGRRARAPRPIWRSCSSACCRATIDAGTVTARPVTAVITSCPFWWPRPLSIPVYAGRLELGTWQRGRRGPEPGERRAAPAAHVRLGLRRAPWSSRRRQRVAPRLLLLAVRGRRDRLHVALAQEETVPPVQLDLQTRLRRVEDPDRLRRPDVRSDEEHLAPDASLWSRRGCRRISSPPREVRSPLSGFSTTIGRRSIGCPRPWSRARVVRGFEVWDCEDLDASGIPRL